MSACKICLELEPTEDLCSPCDCKGSAGLVHRKCLNEWRQTADNREAAERCMDCNAKYEFEEKDPDLITVICYYSNCLFWPSLYSFGYYYLLYYLVSVQWMSYIGALFLYLLPVNMIIFNLLGKKSILFCLLLDILIYLSIIIFKIHEFVIPLVNIILWILWLVYLRMPDSPIKLSNKRELIINYSIDTPLLTTSIEIAQMEEAHEEELIENIQSN